MNRVQYRSMPKVNLHHHLEGAMRPKTFLELGIQNKFLQPNLRLEDILQFIQIDYTEKNLVDYLKKVDITVQVTKTKQDFIRIAKEIVEDQHLNGVQYLEVRGGPSIHVKEGLYLEDIIEGVLEGLQEGEKATGLKGNFIVTALRHEDPKKNEALAKLAAQYKNHGVVGFDLAGDEVGYPARLHQKVFEIVRSEGLGITVHAGEAVGYESVKEAIELLGAKRIGHGIASIHSKDMLDTLRDKTILLEVCPTSNVHTKAVASYKEHPVKRLFDEGIMISIGDDDPTTSNIDISHEYEVLEKHFGFEIPQMIQLQHYGIEKAFISEIEKQELKNKFEGKVNRFLESIK